MHLWHNRRHLICWFGLAVGCLVAAAIWRGTRGTPSDSGERRFRNWDRDVAYVGDAVCAECHASTYSTFKRSEMGNSWYIPTVEQLTADGWEHSTTNEPVRNFHYRAFVEQGKVFQEEFRLNEAGEKTYSLIREAGYCIGSGAHGRSFVTESNGYLTAMAIGRYRDAGKWDMSPGYRTINLRFERPVPDECMTCHAGKTSYVAGSGNRYRLPLEQGIRSENCHGPGELHANARRQSPVAGTGPDDTIVNPAHLDFKRQNDVCLVCHLIPDAQFARTGKRMEDFRPGMRLADFREDFLVQTAVTDRFGFASHGPRTAQSRCWTEGDTAGQMTCIACHDPHTPLAEVAPQRYVNRCLSCHQSADCTRPERTAADETCVSCHMQRSKVSNIPHVVFTDHWIRARPQPAPVTDAELGEAIASGSDDGRVNLASFWPREKRESGLSRPWAIAQIRYFDMHPQNRSMADLRQAVDVLQRLTKPSANDPEVWFVLGVAQFHLENMKAAGQYYQRAAESPGGYEKAYAHAGEAYESVAMFEQAKEMYRRSVDQWPDFQVPYERLAALYMREGQFAQGIELLRQELDLNPSRAGAWHQLGMNYYLHDQDFEKARDAIRKSLELNPDLLHAYVALGFICSREGRHEEGIEAYEAALRISPQHMESLLGAATLNEQAGDFTRAAELVERAMKTAPGQPELIDRLRRLRARLP